MAEPRSGKGCSVIYDDLCGMLLVVLPNALGQNGAKHRELYETTFLKL